MREIIDLIQEFSPIGDGPDQRKSNSSTLDTPEATIRLYRWQPQIRYQWLDGLGLKDLSNTGRTNVGKLQPISEIAIGLGHHSDS
jgi:hypothetical protein